MRKILLSYFVRPAIRNVTFSDVSNSMEEKELMHKSSSYSTTTTSTEYFSAISSGNLVSAPIYFDNQLDLQNTF